jgi:hypothetical protein
MDSDKAMTGHEVICLVHKTVSCCAQYRGAVGLGIAAQRNSAQTLIRGVGGKRRGSDE